MKKLKWWLAAILVGELIVLRKKDDEFKTKVKESNNFIEKAKIIFDWLVNFNKEIIDDIKSIDQEHLKETMIQRFEKESINLEKKFNEREEGIQNRSEEKLPIYYLGLEKQFMNFEKKAHYRKEKLVDDYDLEKSYEMLKQRLEEARNQLDEFNQKK